jgi:hypothetical protein
MSTSPIPIPTVTANLSLVVPIPLVIDLNTIWLQNYSAAAAILGADVASTDTTITLASAPPPIPLNSSIEIDQEPMLVTAISGGTLTVERGAAAYPFLAALNLSQPAAHAQGAAIYQLLFTRPWDMLASQALRPWVQQQIIALGNKSVTFGVSATGSITATGS